MISGPPDTVLERLRRRIDRVTVRDAGRGCRRRATVGPQTLFLRGASIVNHPGDRRKVQIGPDCVIMGELRILSEIAGIVLGSHCLVREDTRLRVTIPLVVGNYVSFSHSIDLCAPAPWMDRFGHHLHRKATEIDDDVLIGFKVTICEGVHIGRGAMVGASSVVLGDIQPMTIVAGNPARPVGIRPD